MPNEVKLLPCEELVESVKQSLEDVFYDTLNCAFDADLLARAAIEAMSRPTTVVTDEVVERVKRLDEYDPESLPEHLRWKGEGPPPASWYVEGTKVYRSYADYCDD